MKVLIYDPFLSDEQTEAIGGKKVDLDQLLLVSDFITLHTPLTNDTKEAEEAVMETVEKFSTLLKMSVGQIRLFKESSDGANISKSFFQFL